MMNLKKLSLKIEKNQRIIVMSDIHGELHLFKKALQHVHFSKDDVCILVGDICEKGKQSLELIRYLIQLQNEYHIYGVMGNCDTLFEDIVLEEAENDQQIKQYMLWRKHCLFNEMCKESHLVVDENLDIQAMKKLFQVKYQQEFDFLKNLAHIIETDDAIFVHAGIKPIALEKQDPMDCLTMPAFMNQKMSFDKWVIVGHWPVSNYSTAMCCHNCRLDQGKHIIGIDGGNTIKIGGQINILIMEKGMLQSSYVDDYPLIIALENQKGSEKGMNLSFPYTECEIIEQNENESLVYLKYFKINKTFKNDRLYYRGNQLYCFDEVIDDLEVHQSEILSLIQVEENRAFVKKDGVCGWYYGKYQKVGEDNEMFES